MNKYILIYKRKVLFYQTFDKLETLQFILKQLNEIYENDSDFSYEVYYGKDVTSEFEKE